MTDNTQVSIPVENEATRTLLLVDDEPYILSALSRILRREHYHILTAGCGDEALALLAQNSVGVILTDQRMRHTTGTVLIDQVRVLYPNVVCIVMSGLLNDGGLIDVFNKGGIFKILPKPWVDVELLETVRSALRHYGAN